MIFYMSDLNKPSESLGQRISRLRKAKGMTQKDLAEALNITRDLVASYENDRIRIYDEMIIKISRLFSISSDQLLGNIAIPADSTIPINPNLLRRMKAIQSLPTFQQKSLFVTIDNFLKGAGTSSDDSK